MGFPALVQKSKSRESEAALTAITEQRAQTVAEFQRTLSGELVEAQRKVGGLSEDLIKAEQKTKSALLTAPVELAPCSNWRLARSAACCHPWPSP